MAEDERDDALRELARFTQEHGCHELPFCDEHDCWEPCRDCLRREGFYD